MSSHLLRANASSVEREMTALRSMTLAFLLPFTGVTACAPCANAGECSDPVSRPADAGSTRANVAIRDGGLVIFGSDTVVVEVADSRQEQERGLMDRESVPDGTGMLFVFEREESQSFWMENTPVSLDVAFLDASLRIVDIQTMQALSTTPHTSKRPAQYALEVRAGWFESRGIQLGTTASFVAR